MLISIPVANLIQGVSQQPPQMRLVSQAQEQINGYSSPTDGLTKRPPTQFVGVLNGGPTTSTALYHFIDRDTTEKYVLSFEGSTVKAWTLGGAVVPVYGSTWGSSMPSGWSTYMTGAGSTNTRVMSIADTTFIVNKSVAVAKTTATAAAQTEQALVTVTQGSYKCTYTITLDGTAYTVKTWDGNAAAAGEINTIKTEDIADNLRTAIIAGAWTVARYGSTLHIKRSSGSNSFTLKTSDSGGDTLLVAAKGTVPRISDLPTQGPNGFKIAVNPEPGSDGSEYWVELVVDSTAANGYWSETVAPGAETTLNSATMPFVIKRKIDTTNGVFFAVEAGPWSTRSVGTVTTNPWPSFLAQTIQDVFFHKNRLCFLSGDKIVMSEAGNYYNFFRTSIAQVLDSDPIDIGTLHTSVSVLRAAVPYNEAVIVFSDQAQFVIRTANDEPLTSKTVTSMKATEFSSSSALCRPVGTGKSIIFMQSDSRYCGMREYVQISTTNTNYDAVDLTAHVNSYIEGAPNNLAISSYDNLAVVSTDRTTNPTSGPPVLWNYKWLMNGSEKIQSAWSKWTFPGSTRVCGIEWFNKKLYMVIVRNGAANLEFMDFEVRVPDPTSFLPHLDCLVKPTSITWNGVTSVMTTTVNGETANFVNLSPKAVVNGIEVDVLGVSTSSVTTRGNAVNQIAYVGIPYEMEYTFSPVYIRQQNVPVLDGRLTLTYGSVSYSDTNYFKVTVSSDYRPSYSYEFFGGSFDANFLTDTVNLERGTFRYSLHAKNDDVSVKVSTNSHFPIRLNSASFEAQFVTRSRV